MGLLYSIYYGGYWKFFKLQLRRLLQLLPLVWPILNFPLVHWQSEPISRIRKDIQCCLINLVDKHDIAGESLLRANLTSTTFSKVNYSLIFAAINAEEANKWVSALKQALPEETAAASLMDKEWFKSPIFSVFSERFNPTFPYEQNTQLRFVSRLSLSPALR